LTNLAAHETHAATAEPRDSRLRTAFEFAAWVALFSLLSLIFAVTVISPALAETTASVNARNETGYARLEFKFKAMPGYTNEVASDVLVLNFDDQVNIDLSEVPERIPDYVALARRDPDGRAFRFAMQRAFRINAMEAGNRLFIDLLPPSWIGAPPSLPKHVMRELSLKALEAERKVQEEARQREDAKDPYKLEVEVAEQPTFTRLVFAWNKFVTANLSRQGRKVSLTFGRYAKANLNRLKVDPPKYLRGAEAEKTKSGMTVVLTVGGDVDVKGFREGNSYVLDLANPDDASVEAARAVSGVEDVRITTKPDARVVPLPEAKSYLGFIFARGEEPAAVEREFGGQRDVHVGEGLAALEGGVRPRGFQDDEVGAVAVHVERRGERGDEGVPRCPRLSWPADAPAVPFASSSAPSSMPGTATARTAGVPPAPR